MKKIYLLLIIELITAKGFSQDSISNPKMLLRPYLEGGISFIRNDLLKQNYSTQAIFNFGAGCQIGHPERAKIIPFVQYSRSGYVTQQEINPGNKIDSTLLMHSIFGGSVFTLKKKTDTYLNLKIAYCYGRIKESFYAIDGDAHGFLIGLSIGKRIIHNSRIYADLSYNFQKTKKYAYRDFDVIRLNIGFVL